MTELVRSPVPFEDLEDRLIRALVAGQGDGDVLDQCRALLAEAHIPQDQPTQPVLRTVHHFACTGGTLLSKCIASMPCVRLLSEVDPFSEMTHQRSFVPTDLIGLAKLGSAPPDDKVLAEMFLAGLAVLAGHSRAEGRDLVLRDHTHSHFCHGREVPRRPSLRQLLQPDYQLLSLVSVRHPLDSYLSLQGQNWLNIEPATLEEYARRYHLFLDHYEGIEVLRYEDFVADPEGRMKEICDALQLAFNPYFQDVFSAIHLSGDSGRRGDQIASRPRRRVPDALIAEMEASAAYQSLCSRLDYDPAPQQT